MTNDKPIVIRLSEEDAREWYQAIKDKDDDEVVRPRFEMPVEAVREELIHTFGLLILDPPESED